MSDEKKYQPLEMNTEEAYVLNHLVHIGMTTIFEPTNQMEIDNSAVICIEQIRAKFDQKTFNHFQDKLNAFFTQYMVEGDTLTSHGSANPNNEAETSK